MTALYLLYETMDLSALSDRTIGALAVVGLLAGRWRRSRQSGAAGRVLRRARPSVRGPFVAAILTVWAGGASPGWPAAGATR